MSRPKSVPSYRLHRQSGQAIVTLADPTTGRRRDYLLGPFNSPVSRAEYARLLMEHQTLNDRLPAKASDSIPSDLTLNELIAAYNRHLDGYYVKDGKPTKEPEVTRLALGFLEPYGDSIARTFGPLALRA